MYNEELEKLIEMALLDGELTEKEKQVLLKKAETFGVDLDEFEMVLDAKLYEKQQSVKPAKENLPVVDKDKLAALQTSRLRIPVRQLPSLPKKQEETPVAPSPPRPEAPSPAAPRRIPPRPAAPSPAPPRRIPSRPATPSPAPPSRLPPRKSSKTERNLSGTPVNKPFVNLQTKNLPGVNLPTNNPTCIGRGYNALNGNYVCEDDVKWRYPILLLSENDIIAKNAPNSYVFSETENTLKELIKKTNTKLEVKGRYMMFSASFKAEFSKEEKSKEEYAYTKVMGIHHKERLNFKYTFNDCKPYLNPEFVRDLNGNMQPDDLFTKYGTHLILGIYMGGRVEANFSTRKTEKETKEEIKTRTEAGISGPISASGNLSTAEQKKAIHAWTNSTAKIRTWGGNSYAGSTYNDFCTYNPQWVKSLNDAREKWTLCDIPKDSVNNAKGYNEDFVPIWELCTNQERKKVLFNHFESLNKTVENGLLTNEMYVVDIMIISHSKREKALEQRPDDFILIDKDLNKGAGGDYIAICYKLGHISANPFTSLCIEISPPPLNTGYHNCTHDGKKAKYYRWGSDLNKNTKKSGDPYIYLNGTKDKVFGPIRRLDVIIDESRTDYPEWKVVTEKGTTTAADCNKGAKGAYIYVLYKR